MENQVAASCHTHTPLPEDVRGRSLETYVPVTIKGNSKLFLLLNYNHKLLKGNDITSIGNPTTVITMPARRRQGIGWPIHMRVTDATLATETGSGRPYPMSNLLSVNYGAIVSAPLSTSAAPSLFSQSDDNLRPAPYSTSETPSSLEFDNSQIRGYGHYQNTTQYRIDDYGHLPFSDGVPAAPWMDLTDENLPLPEPEPEDLQEMGNHLLDQAE